MSAAPGGDAVGGDAVGGDAVGGDAPVRAGSGVARVPTADGERLLVVQDDANFLAVVDGRLLSLAAAEGSPTVVDDGAIVGSALGVCDAIDPPGGAARGARWTPRVDARGAPFAAKAEGLTGGGDGRLWLVRDQDDPDAPSVRCAVARVDGG